MTSHYDLKQQEKKKIEKKRKKKQWCFGGWAVGGGSQIFLSYIWGGVEYFFPTGLGGGGIVKIFAYHMKM